MDEARKAQIALVIFRHELRGRAPRIKLHSRSDIARVARNSGISPKESEEFAEAIMRESVEETLGKRAG